MFSLSKGEPPTPPSTASDLVSSIPNPSVPMEKDSGYEPSPCCFPDNALFSFDENSRDDVFESAEEMTARLFGELNEGGDWCPDCGNDPSCSCCRTDSSATTVRRAGSSFTNPNTCDSDSSSSRSSSPPPSSRNIPVPCRHTHNDRLPCPCCSEDESSEGPSTSMSYLQNIVTSRSFPGSYPAAFLNWWTRSSSSSPRVDAAQSRTSNRSDDRRNRRSRRRMIDSDASSSSSGEDNSSDEIFPITFEAGSYMDSLGTMTETEDVRVTSSEQLPDIVPLTSDSRRVRSQSVSIPLDHEYLREIGISLRRFSNEFENRFAVRNGTINRGGRH